MAASIPPLPTYTCHVPDDEDPSNACFVPSCHNTTFATQPPNPPIRLRHYVVFFPVFNLRMENNSFRQQIRLPHVVPSETGGFPRLDEQWLDQVPRRGRGPLSTKRTESYFMSCPPRSPLDVQRVIQLQNRVPGFGDPVFRSPAMYLCATSINHPFFHDGTERNPTRSPRYQVSYPSLPDIAWVWLEIPLLRPRLSLAGHSWIVNYPTPPRTDICTPLGSTRKSTVSK